MIFKVVKASFVPVIQTYYVTCHFFYSLRGNKAAKVELWEGGGMRLSRIGLEDI